MNNITFSNTDINTKQHRFIGQREAYTTYIYIPKHTNKHSYLTLMYQVYTNMYLQTSNVVARQRSRSHQTLKQKKCSINNYRMLFASVLKLGSWVGHDQ